MVASLAVFLTFLGFLFLGKRAMAEQSTGVFKVFALIQVLREFPSRPRSFPHLYIFLAYVFFLCLPLAVGLSIYLQSDANVLVVVFWIVYCYNVSKYIFFSE